MEASSARRSSVPRERITNSAKKNFHPDRPTPPSAGNWAKILKDPKFATPLKGRSNKDLSDKWRALTPKTGKTTTKAKTPTKAAPKSPAKSPVKKTPAKKTPTKKTPVKKTPAKKTPVKKSPAKPVTPTRPPSARRAAKAATPKAKAVAPKGGVTKKTLSKTVVKSPAKSPAKPAKKKEGGGFCVIM